MLKALRFSFVLKWRDDGWEMFSSDECITIIIYLVPSVMLHVSTSDGLCRLVLNPDLKIDNEKTYILSFFSPHLP